MELYYTVSSSYNASQPNVVNSIGGYKSSTIVINDDFDNLFGEISLFSMKEGKTGYRVLVLKNDTTEEVNNVELWFELPTNSYCNYQLGAAVMAGDSENGYYTELLGNQFSKPKTVQLYNATIENKVTVGSMAAGQEIALFISREIDKDKAREDYNNVAERDPDRPSRFRPIKKETDEVVNFQIIWE